MGKGVIKVFREGKNTQTRLRVDKGIPEHTLFREGAGQMHPGEFAEPADARAFALGEVRKDPSAVFHILDGRLILDTVADQEFQNRRNKSYRLKFAFVTAAAVLAMALCVSVFAIPFASPALHGVFAAGMTLLYLVLLSLFGARNVHAFMMIVLLLVLTIFLAPAIQKLLEPDKAPVSQTAEPRR